MLTITQMGRTGLEIIPGLFIGLVLILTPACTKTIDLPDDIPVCIRDRIVEISQDEVWNPPAKIYSYSYKGETVYYFPSRCCDIPSTLLDRDCNVICSPDGGLTGQGDLQCTDFFDVKTNEKLIWEDPR